MYKYVDFPHTIRARLWPTTDECMCMESRWFLPPPPSRCVITNSAARVVYPSGSWVELEELIAAVSSRESLTGPQDSISSALHGELERILLEAQLECERSKDRLVWMLCVWFVGGGAVLSGTLFPQRVFIFPVLVCCDSRVDCVDSLGCSVSTL